LLGTAASYIILPPSKIPAGCKLAALTRNNKTISTNRKSYETNKPFGLDQIDPFRLVSDFLWLTLILQLITDYWGKNVCLIHQHLFIIYLNKHLISLPFQCPNDS